MRKIFSIFAALTLSVGLWSVDNVAYIDAAGVLQHKDGVTEITNASTSLESGWYVVNGADVQTGSLSCTGEVHLILADGAKLTATGGEKNKAGIEIAQRDSLTIYAQSTGEQMGQLIATGGQLAAGIGDGNEYGNGTYLTINGGRIIATGGEKAAGIGSPSYGRNITINGGIITAKGGTNGAGIGGGDSDDGEDITINGGIVTATGGENAAGIGGGKWGEGFRIFIYGGIVTATGGSKAAGIGAGEGSFSDPIGKCIIINGGKVIATAGEGGAGIGNGADSKKDAKGIKVATMCVVKAGDTENPTTEIATTRTAATDIADDLKDKQYVEIETPTAETISISYVDENGVSYNVNAVEITTIYAALSTGWYVVKGEDVQIGTLYCMGAVNLILADGAKLTATGDEFLGTPGIQVSGEGRSLTIYGQTAQSGQLIATGAEYYAAGIGGGEEGEGSNITINGGKITANGGLGGAAIGGGMGGFGSNITINKGEVIVNGGMYAAGIGGGAMGSGSNITINGGKVIATGGEEADGIGNGYETETPASDIFVATSLVVKAGDNENPTEEITNDGSDLANSLAGKRYATVEKPAGPATSLPNVNSKFLIQNSKLIKNGQLIIRKGDKTYTILGQGL